MAERSDAGDEGVRAPLVVIVGATASGKSEVALQCAKRVGGEIVNADALQLYRGMDIGTAKTPVSERAGLRHHLLDVLGVRQEASVARYQREARAAVADIRARERVPIAVGGSGLYVRALTDRMEFPPSHPQVRRDVEDWVREVGCAHAHAHLRAVDPEAAKRINVADERRIVRALEVGRVTGKPFSAFLPSYEFADPHIVYVGLRRERSDLHHRVTARVYDIMERGFEQEVRALMAEGIEDGRTARQAIGYAQMIAFVHGRMSAAQAIEDTITGTRKLVRKQDTWFRRDPRVTWVDASHLGQAVAAVEGLIERARVHPPHP